jgi:hypothetical protein
MSISRLPAGRRPFRYSLFAFALVIAANRSAAQEHDDDHDHDHDHLHFSHPMVTESPSPDTKFRFDYARAWVAGSDGATVNEVKAEAEYGFTPAISLAIVTPFIWVTGPVGDRVSGLGNIELSLKAAKVASEAHNVLIGGGLSAGLPTGNDAKGIGSGHLIELEPFVDGAYKVNALEFVAFARVSSIFRRRAGDENDRELAFDFSTLYRINPAVEALLEATSARPLVGPERGIPQTFVAPGVKVYPFTNKQIMFGASVLFGTGVVSNTRGALVSAFYHF